MLDNTNKKGKKIINQKDLIKIVLDKYKNLNFSQKEAENFFQLLIKETIESLKNDVAVKITSFGTFSIKTRYSRGGVNPRNPKEKIKIPAVKVAKFKKGKKLKDALK